MSDTEDSGEGLFRTAPAVPYEPTTAQLRVPRQALALTLDLFTRAGRREMCSFWYGPASVPELQRVSAVVIPRQRQSWGNYHVTADAMQLIHAQVSPLHLVNFAQVHSHPGARVEHSRYDDRMANSRRALSLVIPHYGGWQGAWPQGIGIHEFQRDYWHLLNGLDAERRVVLTEDTEVRVIDCR
jgi:proteasome lid subunit RPN8/RPN11